MEEEVRLVAVLGLEDEVGESRTNVPSLLLF